MWAKYAAKRGVQIARMILQIRSKIR
ncbi:DUF6783 domain-containing protein [Ruminococcus sp. RTP21358st1_A5_RTP21358_211008]